MAEHLPFEPALATTQETSAMRSSYLLYTSSDNMRYMLSADTLLCRAASAAISLDGHVGHANKWGLLLCREPISAESLAIYSRPPAFPVAVELDLLADLDREVLGYFDGAWHRAAVSRIVEHGPDLLFIPGNGSMRLARRFHFRSDQDLRGFHSSKFKNIVFNPRRSCATPKLFDGTYRIDTGVVEQIGAALSDGETNSLAQWFLARDRVRGSLLGLLGSCRRAPTEDVTVEFDQSGLEVIAVLAGASDYDFASDLARIRKAIAETGGGDTELSGLKADPGDPVRSWPTVASRQLAPSRAAEPAPHATSADETFFRSALESLFSAQPDAFVSLDWLSRAVEHFLSGPDLVTGPTTDAVAEAASAVRSGIQGRRRMADVVRELPLASLKAASVFAVAWRPDSLSELLAKVEAFSLGAGERRLALSYFGALHGLAALGSSFKDQELPHLALSDLLLPSHPHGRARPLEPVFREAADQFASYGASQGDTPLVRALVRSALGIPIIVTVAHGALQLWRQLTELLRSADGATRLQQALLEAGLAPRKHLGYEVKISGDYRTWGKNGGLRIRSQSRPAVTPVWEDWDGFRALVLESRDEFCRLAERELTHWRSAIDAAAERLSGRGDAALVRDAPHEPGVPQSGVHTVSTEPTRPGRRLSKPRSQKPKTPRVRR